MIVQQFSWHHLNEWHFGVLPISLLLVVGIAYGAGIRRVESWPSARVVSFYLGIVVTFLATESVLGVYDMKYFSDHMIQHLLLIMVAAPLFAFGAPLELAYDAGNYRVRGLLDGRVMRAVTHPLFGFGAYFIFVPLTHLTGLFNLMLEYQWIHHTEQIGFLVVGYLFFRGAFGRERGVTIHPGLRLVYVMVAVPVDTFTGLALMMEARNPFPAYTSLAPAGSTSASILANIHLGGAIMWIGGDALMLIACIPITVAWVKWETIRTKELDIELDALGL
ncbi:MAG: cytochrome c oxidase assembly protein [Acidimicrobiales bacterium]